MKHHKPTILKNQKGYLAVFVVLTFQVLFIFFAMVVNIGILIHDKINLQNSVDLAAYYAAGKQAELLNAIAHSNYQIRQAYKLLAWRVRVLGDMANQNHPLFSNTNQNSSFTDNPFNSLYPIVCIQHTWWDFQRALPGQPDNTPNQNFCQIAYFGEEGKDPPKFPEPPPVIADFLGFNTIIRQQIQNLRDLFSRACTNYGSINFIMATNWMRAYRGDVQNRVQIIDEFSRRLTFSDQDMIDLEGGSVLAGAQKTLQKNLTVGNAGDIEFKFFNSMGGLRRQDWLSKIAVRPEVFYLDSTVQSGSDTGCEPQPKQCSQPPTLAAQVPSLGTAEAASRADICKEPQQIDAPNHSTVGFEKNPWYMAYVGVEATVQGRRPFAPFGAPIALSARSFAQPFGGRVGPWFNSQWPRSNNRSQGGRFVDPLLPFQVLQGGTSLQDSRNRKNVSIPNYSRYPGDQLGLRSQVAVGVIQRAFVASAANRLNPSEWDFLSAGTFQSPEEDPLAWNSQPPPVQGVDPQTNTWVRAYEIGAIMPDLFDLTYYSIEPQFLQNYISRLGQAAFLNGGTLRPDLGYRANQNFYQSFNVARQIAIGQSQHDARSYWVSRRWDQLLTGWVPHTPDAADVSVFNYSFPERQFGECLLPRGNEPRPVGTQTPGGCVVGGRTGYSVRFIAEDYLNDNNVTDGGDGNRGPILNPPPQSF